MRQEDYIAYFFSTLCLLLILYSSRYNKKFALLNIIVWICYTSYLYYGFYFNSEYGGALAWWFYLTSISILQTIVLIGYMIMKRVKDRKSS